jgi:hypothetical protein
MRSCASTRDLLHFHVAAVIGSGVLPEGGTTLRADRSALKLQNCTNVS